MRVTVSTNGPDSAVVTALTPLRALVITKDAIEHLFETAPELSERFSKILAARDAQLHARRDAAEKWAIEERDLLSVMRTFFARTFAGNDRRHN